MEKNITIYASQSATELITEIVKNIISIICRPVALLSLYYSHCLEREITIKQTWILLDAQAAFFAAIFSCTEFSIVSFICIAWLLHAIKLCKDNL